MANEIANLEIRIKSMEAELAERRLRGLEGQGRKTERATDGLTAAFLRFAGPAAVAAGAVAGLTKVVSVTRQFDVLNAQLITATGSAEDAARAFEAIQDFATQTPYDLQQATEGFTKLVNLGLTPSERAMRSYGDTASAMGKSLMQMVEAVADATTGEFERLKEFGIRSKKQGDEVSFTFRGITETVRFEAAAIEEYLTRLGENNFAGAMAERMDTLDGAISNMGDAWNKMWLTISKQGIGTVIEDTFRMATAALEEFTAMIASGQLGGYLDAILDKFNGWGDGVRLIFDYLNDMFEAMPTQWKDRVQAAVDFFINYFKFWPENVKMILGIVGNEIGRVVEYAAIYGQAFVDIFVAKFDQLVAKAKVYGTAIGESLNPFGEEFDLEGQLAKIDAEYEILYQGAIRRTKIQAGITKGARDESIKGIVDERDTAIQSFEDQIKKADEARAKFEAAAAARLGKPGEDRLAEFKAGGEDPEEKEKREAARVEAAREKNLANVVKYLQTEEEAIQSSYDRRLELILANTEEGSEKQAELIQRLNEKFGEEALGQFRAPITYEDQLAELEEYYTNRRMLILNNVQLTEEERSALEEELTIQRNERLKTLELQRTSVILGATSELFGGLAGLAKNFAGEQSGIYKGLFALSKGFAIADSLVKIQQGIANAAALPFPGNLAAMGTVVAATGSIVSTIQGTQFAGAFDNGGNIGYGQFGLVGEYGPELIEGPVRVRSRRETAEAFNAAQAAQPQQQAAQAQMPDVNLNPVMVLDSAILTDYLNTPDGEEAIVEIMNRNKVA